MTRLYYLTVLGLAAIAVAQLMTRMPWHAGGGTEAFVHPSIGEKLATRVSAAGHPAGLPLSELATGNCRYIVVYSPQCGASRTLAHQWHQQLHLESEDPFPEGWTVMWASVADSSNDDDFFPQHFQVRRVYPAPGSNLARDAGISAFPVHLVLDRTGTVRSSGVGGRLPSRSAFHPDCSVDVDKR